MSVIQKKSDGSLDYQWWHWSGEKWVCGRDLDSLFLLPFLSLLNLEFLEMKGFVLLIFSSLVIT